MATSLRSDVGGDDAVAVMADGIVDIHGRLRVQGNFVVGQAGVAAPIRGMSLFWSQWQPQYFDVRTLQWLRDDWGITVVRAPLGVHPDGYLANPRGETQKIVSVVEAAIDLGIYVIVDWHAHHPERIAACQFFAWLANNYGAYDNLLYEIWNEPDGKYSWCRDIKPYHEAVIGEIRAAGSNNLVIAGTPHWCHRVDVVAADRLNFDDVVYSLHFYAGSNRQPLRALASAAFELRLPLFVSEWGTCRADAGGQVDCAEAEQWLDFLEERRIGHVNWAVADKLETAAALKPGASPAGEWQRQDLTESGSWVRSQLRAFRHQ